MGRPALEDEGAAATRVQTGLHQHKVMFTTAELAHVNIQCARQVSSNPGTLEPCQPCNPGTQEVCEPSYKVAGLTGLQGSRVRQPWSQGALSALQPWNPRALSALLPWNPGSLSALWNSEALSALQSWNPGALSALQPQYHAARRPPRRTRLAGPPRSAVNP